MAVAQGKKSLFSRDFALEVERRISAFFETNEQVKEACAELRMANVGCGFTCNACGKTPETAPTPYDVAYQSTGGEEFDMCQYCYNDSTVAPNHPRESMTKIDLRFPPVVHGPDVLGFERLIFEAHVAALKPEELEQHGVPKGVNPFPFILEQMVEHRSKDAEIQAEQKRRISKLIADCTAIDNVPFQAIPTPREHLALDKDIGDMLLSEDSVKEFEAIAAVEEDAPEERIRKIETFLCEKEAEVCQRRGLDSGFRGIVQLKAIALFLFETAVTEYHPMCPGAGIGAGVAKANIRDGLGRKFFGAAAPPGPPPGGPPVPEHAPAH